MASVEESRRKVALDAAIAAQPANSGTLAGQVDASARAAGIVAAARVFEVYLRGDEAEVKP